jgi:hypothetical protein
MATMARQTSDVSPAPSIVHQVPPRHATAIPSQHRPCRLALVVSVCITHVEEDIILIAQIVPPILASW